MRSLLLVLTALVLLGCVEEPAIEQTDETCYELNGQYPENCWRESEHKECCAFQVPNCLEIQCSPIKDNGYSDCYWLFEKNLCSRPLLIPKDK